MKVYVVKDWWKYEDQTIRGVFDSKEKAVAYSNYLEETVTECPDAYFTDVEEYIVQ